ncbi:multicopper oxidase family protein [Nonomuraea sp. FMUSA5-5]|uniref:Multicopper oxidase family protein n=1 Tax=Nonomuraea composti TaxID=2720023 RepID=A0ABX1B328_9ACTN|nr:multicopper oxidase family protein [Nonomuraea sp. FMUSA5-5]NJP91751.1 multicopper oxidase family protein [Nonomuraea sp. FMUSA5-5]
MARPRRLRLVAAVAATLAVVAPLAWMWRASLLPAAYSIMEMGYRDSGGQAHGHHEGGTRSVTSLVTERQREPDVDVTLTARKQRVRLASGREVGGYTLNGRSPGPEIQAEAGQLIQVRLINESVPGGVTLHWHGVDVPGGEDGVAGVTQDAVGVGQEFVYRFVARQIGTFWYHSHQLSHEQVAGGLLGALIIRPARAPDATVDVVALTHLYNGIRTLNGSESDLTVPAPPGTKARVRVINTDNGPIPVWVTGAMPRLVAVDGTDLHGPGPIGRAAILVTSGGRADVEVTMPSVGTPVRMQIGGPLSVVLAAHPGSVPAVPPRARPPVTLDLLTYGTPAPVTFDAARPDRVFRYEMGRRPGFVDGLPGLYWTVNGRLYPDVPMFMVAEGDVVRMTIVNDSGEVHPMHLHGHHALVLSRDGVPATGSPWWIDSLNVEDGESYDIAFRAGNPGIWVDHCHNLPHAREGLLVHLMYENVTTPFLIGGPLGNSRE